MGYVDKSLIPGERVVYRGTVSWLITLKDLSLLVLSLYLFGAGDGWSILAFILFFSSLISLVPSVLWILTTELAVTSKRVIAKFGVIKRHTIELNHNHITSFGVNQTILGRILRYGSITVHSSGSSAPIHSISNPAKFKTEAMKAVDISLNGNA